MYRSVGEAYSVSRIHVWCIYLRFSRKNQPVTIQSIVPMNPSWAWRAAKVKSFCLAIFYHGNLREPPPNATTTTLPKKQGPK